MTTALAIHRVTAITGDAPQNVDFYAGILGLPLVMQTVNIEPSTLSGLAHHVTDSEP